MRYVTYTYQGQTHVGALEADTVRPIRGFDTLRALILAGGSAVPDANGQPLAEVTLNAPLIPGKIVAVGKNYAAHAQEMKGEVPKAPLLFSKYPSAVIGDGEAIAWRESITTEVDWEGELGVVIGRRGKDIPQADAYDYIFGYTVVNDVSARDLQYRVDTQWARAKGMDTFCPLGPCVVTRDEVADPHALSVRTLVNDVTMQDGTTADMFYTIPMLVAYISQMFTLEPGDLILTGTPSGVGHGRTPQVFLKDGDVVTVSIESVGSITNPCRVLP